MKRNAIIMRILIFPEDICILNGYKNHKTGRKYYKIMMDFFKRTKEQGLLISQYCEYMKADERTVLKNLKLI